MRRRWIIGLLAGCCLAALLAVLALTGDREPRFRGKSLSQWLMVDYQAKLNDPFSYRSVTFHDPNAKEAIRHIGTNALPWLLKWIACEPSSVRCNIYTQFCRLPPKLQPGVVKHLLTPPDPPLQLLAFNGFMFMETNASPAVPDLLRVIHQSKPGSSTRELTMRCLFRSGGSDALSKLVNDPDPPTREFARRLFPPDPPYYLKRPPE